MQYQMSGPGDQDLNDPDRDVDDGFDMHAIVGMQQRQEDMDEDYDEIQRMLAVYVVMKDSVFMLVLCAYVRACVRACVCVCVVVFVGFVVVVVSFGNTSLSQALPDVLRLFFQKKSENLPFVAFLAT